MNIKVFALAGVALAALAAQPAKAADFNLLATSGKWQVSSGIVDGRAVCLMGQATGDRTLAIAVAADEPGFSVRVRKSSWHIPATEVPMDISFDGVNVTNNGKALPTTSGKGLIFLVQ